MAEGMGWQVMYTFPPCGWPSQQLHGASLSSRSLKPSNHHVVGEGQALTSGLLGYLVPVDEQQRDCMYTCCYSSLSTSLSSGWFSFFWRKSKTTWLVFPFSRQHWSGLTHPKMGGLRGTFAPALYSTISSPLVLGPKSCFGAHSYQNPALRIADGLRVRPASCGDTKTSLKILTST